jgi:hypothetical protein
MIKYLMDLIKRMKQTLYSDKIYHLLIISIFYTFLYLTLDDTHFSGINKLQQIMRDELIKKEVKETVLTETFSNNNDTSNEIKREIKREIQKDNAIDKSKDDVKNAVISDDLTPSKIEHSLLQKTYNRFYYSLTNGCLLGYGDIYPISNIAKFIVMTQTFITISLIMN